ncbi:hypothetical protein EYF80_056928 [Liparis tanakae]|uniref:Uncharacterized protein n=1 Tax=Liparis tanakae TaxID=230148 RepID=A0A4Z2EW86_9TELE|nr:hypothetical protein EYF80_056928 [Liparis tanakae]
MSYSAACTSSHDSAYLLLLVPGEGDVELRQDFVLLGFLQLLLVEPVGGHALVGAAGGRLVLHHHGADVDAVGVNLQEEATLPTAAARGKGGAEETGVTLEEEAME